MARNDRGQVDPMAVLVVLAIFAAIWGGWQVYRGLKWTGCKVVAVLHIHECKKPDVGAPPIKIDEIEVN